MASTYDTPPTNGHFPDGPYPQYIGTNSSHTFHSILTSRVLVYLTGENINLSQNECQSASSQSIWKYHYMKNNTEKCALCKESDENCNRTKVTCGVCKRSLSFSMPAISPIYLSKDYSYTDNTYGAWTESVWTKFACNIFLMANPSLDIIYLAVGIVIIILSMCLTWLIKKYSNTLLSGA